MVIEDSPAPITPSSTIVPSSSPVPTPTPLPSPRIADAWYAKRTEEMRFFMRKYGQYSDEASLDERILRMEIDPDKPMVALTFDDGPVEGVTDRIVATLAAYDARATFYIRGARMKFDETQGLLEGILAGGNEIGNHTWRHRLLPNCTVPEMVAQIKQTNDGVLEATGYTIRTLRPPGGKYDETVLRQAGKLDMPVVLWSQSGNVHEQDPAAIEENIFVQAVNGKALEDGDIILLHDTKPWVADAIERIVPRLIEEGYQLVTVQELLHLSERGWNSGELYRKQN